MQSFLAITGLINGIISLGLGFLVLAIDRKKFVNQLYFMFTVSISFWALSYFFWMLQSSDYSAALFWTRALTVGSIFMPVFHLHWIAVCLNRVKKNKYIIWYNYAQGIFFLCLCFTPLMVSGVAPFRDVFTFWPQPGAIYPYYLFNIFISCVYSTYLLISQYRISQGMEKLKIRYLMIASFVAYFSACSNFPLWYGVPIIPVTNALFIFFPLFIAYAIARHHLMDIRLVLKKSTVLLASVGTILIYLVGIRYLSLGLLIYKNFLVDTLLVLTAVLIYPTIQSFYFKLSNKYFFSSLYNFQELVAGLSEKISSTLNINDIYQHINDSFYRAFYPKSFSLLLYQRRSHKFSLEYGAKLNSASQQELQKIINQLTAVINQQKIIFVDDLALVDSSDIRAIAQKLNKLEIDLLLPLYFQGQIMGLAALGNKESKEIYNDEDLKVFNVVCSQIAISLKNAILHQESLIYADTINAEKNKISAILSNFIDPIIFVDQNKHLGIFNPAAQTVFGLKKSDLGKSLERLVFKTDQLKAIITAESEPAAGQKEIFIEQNGAQKYFKALSATVLGDKKEPLGTLKIFYDLTEEKELDKSKSDFISVAAHQLRTPLSAIKWIFELLLRKEAGEIQPEQQHYLEMGKISNEKLIIIVNDLLNISKIESGNVKLSLSQCDLKKVLAEAQINVDGQIKGKHLKLDYELPDNLPLVTADAGKLSMIIENILSNAANYTPDNGKIKVSARVEDGLMVISVADNGIGIPEADQKKIFTKFFRAGNAIKVHSDGSGLGLFIAKNILKMHNGDLAFESQVGKGTTVIIKLPLGKN